MIIKPKGTKDIIDNIAAFLFLEQKFRGTAKSFNYEEIRTPIFESENLFVRATPEAADVVLKEIYSFEDKKGRILALRPEATASVARALIENKLIIPNEQVKKFYMGKMFRYERPQKGRQREFNQFGIENIGNANIYTDIEVIIFATTFLEKIGIKNFSLKINTLGTEKERTVYKEELKKYFKDLINNMCTNCKSRYETNILRILDCKVCKFDKSLPIFSEFLTKKSAEEFKFIQSTLESLKIKFVVDPKLVRGLDYYSNIVFEIEPANASGSQSVILGGGRYTKLIKQLGGPEVTGTGFAIGVERLLIFLKENNLLPSNSKEVDIFVICNKDKLSTSFEILSKIREKGFSVEFDSTFADVTKQFKRLEKANAKWALFIEEDTTLNNLKFKNQKTKKIITTSINDLDKYIKSGGK